MPVIRNQSSFKENIRPQMWRGGGRCLIPSSCSDFRRDYRWIQGSKDPSGVSAYPLPHVQHTEVTSHGNQKLDPSSSSPCLVSLGNGITWRRGTTNQKVCVPLSLKSPHLIKFVLPAEHSSLAQAFPIRYQPTRY